MFDQVEQLTEAHEPVRVELDRVNAAFALPSVRRLSSVSLAELDGGVKAFAVIAAQLIS